MKSTKILSLVLVLISSHSWAAGYTLYASNNKANISLEEAYQRLVTEPERQLQSLMIDSLQKAQVQQGHFQEILGAYRMSTTGNVTGDNSEAFIFSPYQKISRKKLVQLSVDLSRVLDQDSVALVTVYDENSTIKDTIRYTLMFCNKEPLLSEVLERIKSLAPAYQNGYSIQILDLRQPFADARVSKIQWIGHGFDSEELKLVFPQAKISIEKGKACLVFQDGHISNL